VLSQLLHIGLWVGASLAAALMLVNALYMLISPRAWFKLPRYLRVQGMANRRDYESGSGALRLRMIGAITIGTAVWIAFDIISFLLAKR